MKTLRELSFILFYVYIFESKYTGVVMLTAMIFKIYYLGVYTHKVLMDYSSKDNSVVIPSIFIV